MKICGYDGCRSEGTVVWMSIVLCPPHKDILVVDLRQMLFANRLSNIYAEGRLLQHSSGVCYIVILGNGNIKIGYSRNHQTLLKRWQNLHRDYGGRLQILATLPGGETMEAILHTRFAHLRIRSLPMEQFMNVSEILHFANETGIESNGILANQQYQLYTPKTLVG